MRGQTTIEDGVTAGHPKNVNGRRRPRLPLVVYVLALGTFLMGTTEFVVAGLLPRDRGRPARQRRPGRPADHGLRGRDDRRRAADGDADAAAAQAADAGPGPGRVRGRPCRRRARPGLHAAAGGAVRDGAGHRRVLGGGQRGGRPRRRARRQAPAPWGSWAPARCSPTSSACRSARSPGSSWAGAAPSGRSRPCRGWPPSSSPASSRTTPRRATRRVDPRRTGRPALRPPVAGAGRLRHHDRRCAAAVLLHLPAADRPGRRGRVPGLRWSSPASASAPWSRLPRRRPPRRRPPRPITIVAAAVTTVLLLAICLLSGSPCPTIALVALLGLFGLGANRC